RRVVAVTVEELGVRSLCTARRCCREIHAEPVTGQHQAVVLLRTRPAHKPAVHIGQHALGLAVEGMAPAAAPAGLDAHDIAAPHDIAVAQGTQDALVRPAWVDDAAPGSGGVTPGDAPRRMLDAVDAHGDACLRRQYLDL